MTSACILFLGSALLFYLGATLMLTGNLLLNRKHWDLSGRRLLLVGVTIHALGMSLHFLFSGGSPLSSTLVLISPLTIILLAGALLTERYAQLRHLSVPAAPLAFFALLYALLMPVHFDQAPLLLLRYPWVGVHVALSLLGKIGFALAFCAALAYLAQNRALKRGRLNRYLPPLNAAAGAAYFFAALGFSLFSLGLGMGLIWMFGAPGEYLKPYDAKIWMSLPSWLVFAGYLYYRGIAGQHGSRLKWLVVVGFLLALINLLTIRHQFQQPG